MQCARARPRRARAVPLAGGLQDRSLVREHAPRSSVCVHACSRHRRWGCCSVSVPGCCLAIVDGSRSAAILAVRANDLAVRECGEPTPQCVESRTLHVPTRARKDSCWPCSTKETVNLSVRIYSFYFDPWDHDLIPF